MNDLYRWLIVGAAFAAALILTALGFKKKNIRLRSGSLFLFSLMMFMGGCQREGSYRRFSIEHTREVSDLVKSREWEQFRVLWNEIEELEVEDSDIVFSVEMLMYIDMTQENEYKKVKESISCLKNVYPEFYGCFEFLEKISYERILYKSDKKRIGLHYLERMISFNTISVSSLYDFQKQIDSLNSLKDKKLLTDKQFLESMQLAEDHIEHFLLHDIISAYSYKNLPFYSEDSGLSQIDFYLQEIEHFMKTSIPKTSEEKVILNQHYSYVKQKLSLLEKNLPLLKELITDLEND